MFHETKMISQIADFLNNPFLPNCRNQPRNNFWYGSLNKSARSIPFSLTNTVALKRLRQKCKFEKDISIFEMLNFWHKFQYARKMK